MTAFANDNNVKVLSLERFRNAVTATTCSASTIDIALEKEMSFDGLQAAWAWVNGADEHYIVFVTGECPEYDDDGIGKQPWHVTSASFDDTYNVVTLSATPVPWEDAFQRWHLHVSSRSLIAPQPNVLSVRDITQGAISLAADFSSQPFPLGSQAGAPTIACSPCGITGDLNYDFDIDRDGLGITASVSLTPSGLGAEVTAALAVEEALTAEARLTKTLLQRPISGFNFGFVSIGPMIYVDLIAGIDSATAAASLSAGLKMSIPDDSIATLGMDTADNDVSGWVSTFESTLADPQFETAVSVAAQAGLQIRVEFDILAKFAGKTKGLAAGLVIDAPMLTLNAEAKLEAGVCDDETAEMGVDVNVEVGGELAAFAGAGKPADLPNKFDITSVGVPIYTTCMVVSGDPPAATQSSAVPSVSSAVSPWGNFSRRGY